MIEEEGREEGMIEEEEGRDEGNIEEEGKAEEERLSSEVEVLGLLISVGFSITSGISGSSCTEYSTSLP
jgi:hypothetical protein